MPPMRMRQTARARRQLRQAIDALPSRGMESEALSCRHPASAVRSHTHGAAAMAPEKRLEKKSDTQLQHLQSVFELHGRSLSAYR